MENPDKINYLKSLIGNLLRKNSIPNTTKERKKKRKNNKKSSIKNYKGKFKK